MKKCGISSFQLFKSAKHLEDNACIDILRLRTLNTYGKLLNLNSYIVSEKLLFEDINKINRNGL